MRGFVGERIGLMKATYAYMKFSNRIMWTKIFREYLDAFEKGNDQGKHKKVIFVVILRFKLSNYLCVT